MSNQIARAMPRCRLRLTIEPVEVELNDADGSLSLAALQSVIPHASGIYFRSKGADCRTAVKFDGRRFLPPNGHWGSADAEYFIELGAKHSNFPFGSYENASKQFERSVNLIQSMVHGTASKRRMEVQPPPQSNGAREQPNHYSPPATPANGQHKEIVSPPGTPPSTTTMTSTGTKISEESARMLRRAEQNFADMARIASGKDALIDAQREELRKMHEELETLRVAESERGETENEWKTKWEAQKRELDLLRELGKDQENMCQQIEALVQKLAKLKKMSEERVAEFEEKLQRSELEASGWRDKSERQAQKLCELGEQVAQLQRERNSLLQKQSILEEQINGDAREFAKRFQERERVQSELLADNTRLYQIKEQLEERCRDLSDQLANVERENVEKMEELNRVHIGKEELLGKELAVNRERIVELDASLQRITEERDIVVKQLELVKDQEHNGVTSGVDKNPLFSYTQN